MLTNDTDVDAGDTKAVSAVNGAAGNVGAAVTGAHGTLTINANGSYTYVVNENDSAVQALHPGETITDTFNYTVKDAAGLTDIDDADHHHQRRQRRAGGVPTPRMRVIRRPRRAAPRTARAARTPPATC